MKVLALDPGEQNVGWAVIETISDSCPTLNVSKTGKFKHSNSEQKVSKELEKLITVYEPDFVGYELTGKFLKGLYNKIVNEACKKKGIPALGCRVSDIRAELYGNPHMSKRETNRIIKDNVFNLHPEISKDELDAISVGFFITRLRMKQTEEPKEPEKPEESAD